jgi:F0F1-type ATP synthase membrane subunit b/b'
MRRNELTRDVLFRIGGKAFTMGLLFGTLAMMCTATAQAADGVKAQQILDELAAADRARSAQAAAEEAWDRERRNLEALESSLRTALKQLGEGRAEQESRLVEVEGELAKIEAQAPPRAEAESLLAGVVNDAGTHLDRVGRELLPGVVPDAQADASQSALARLQDLVLRLQQTEHAMRSWDVAILDAQLDGKPVAVKVLRCGAVAAWWRSLEGDRYGTAEWRDGVLHLNDAASPALSDGISAAFAVFEGRRVPETVVLPFGHARREE